MPYIVESNQSVREVIIERDEREFAVIRFADEPGSRLMVRKSRLYRTKEEAERRLPYRRKGDCAQEGMTGPTPWG